MKKVIDNKLKFTWYRLPYDINGNPRHIIHYTDLIEAIWGWGWEGFNGEPVFSDRPYEGAVCIAKMIGGNKFNNKTFEDGLLFRGGDPLTEIEKRLQVASAEYLKWSRCLLLL